MATPLQNPYQLDFDANLVAFWFDKDAVPRKELDQIVASFLIRLRDDKELRDYEVVLWRGEYQTQRMENLVVVALTATDDERIPEILLDLFGDHIGGLTGDYGLQRRINTGCEPYLLWRGGQLWCFDTSKSFGSGGIHEVAGTRFDVRYLRSAHKAEKREVASLEHQLANLNDGLKKLVSRWRVELTARSCRNWAKVHDEATELLYHNHGEITFEVLHHICSELIHIPVWEIKMKDFGRTIVRPIWKETPDAFVVNDYSIYIAINSGLSPSEKFFALAHELGHFVHHYPCLQFFAHLFAVIQDQPLIEQRMTALMPQSWWPVYYRSMEKRSDFFASLIIIPYIPNAGLETLYKHSTGQPVGPEGHRLYWLQQFFEPDTPAPSYDQGLRFDIEGFFEHLDYFAQEYRPEAGCYERMAWCLYNRDRVFDRLRADEEISMGPLMEAVKAMITPRSNHASVPGPVHRLIARRTRDEFLMDLPRREWWDPVIIEPIGTRPEGYFGLMPVLDCDKNTSKMLWTRWEAPNKARVAMLDEWIEDAQSRKHGVMLFPLNPFEIHVHSLINSL